MTEQQDFLERLKDPVIADITLACRQFLKSFPNSINGFIIYEGTNSNDSYSVDMQADDHKAITLMSDNFRYILCQHMNNREITVRYISTTDSDKLHYRVFYIGSKSND